MLEFITAIRIIIIEEKITLKLLDFDYAHEHDHNEKDHPHLTLKRARWGMNIKS
jgi:hypothetical protein